MDFSNFGQKFTHDTGVIQLMDDLGQYVGQPGVKMLGGGNPSRIPVIETYFRDQMARLLDSEDRFENLISRYDGPEGHAPFIDALVDFFQRHYGWEITADNIALTNGSQTSFFYLFNMFAGEHQDGSQKKILLPLTPEYIGYEDAGINGDIFVSYKPEIEFLDNRLFKYHVDFNQLQIDEKIGAICVSRPTNPTGNVLDSHEITQLSQLAQEHNIPLIIDNAYGLPFPNIIFSDEQPTWEPHIVLCMSLSKLGLPGARTGIIIAHETIARTLSNMNAVVSLSPGGFGGALAADAIRTDDVLRLSNEIVRPHYQAKVNQTISWLHEELAGLDYFIHKPEGAIFVWIWFRGLPITSQELYDRLKEKQVLVIPGQHFFPGLPADDPEIWPHRYECIRVSYAGEAAVVHEGIKIIAAEARQAYATNTE